MRMLRGAIMLAVSALAVVPAALSAQVAETRIAELRGIVRDSASGSPIAGAVVMALDADGQPVGAIWL